MLPYQIISPVPWINTNVLIGTCNIFLLKINSDTDEKGRLVIFQSVSIYIKCIVYVCCFDIYFNLKRLRNYAYDVFGNVRHSQATATFRQQLGLLVLKFANIIKIAVLVI